MSVRIDQLYVQVESFSVDHRQVGRRGDIQSRAQEEARTGGEVYLDEHQYTPGMLACCITPVREVWTKWQKLYSEYTAAVEAAKQKYRQTLTAQRLQGTIDDIRVEAERHIDRAHDDAEEYGYTMLEKARTDAERKYNSLRQMHGGREARRKMLVWHAVVLLVIGIGEWFINFAAFEAVFGGIPAVAVSITVVIGAMVAILSYYHGSTVKQYGHYFGPDVDKRERDKNRRVLIVVTVVASLMVLGLIGFARYELAVRTLGPESADEAFNAVMKTYLANLLVWLVGACVTFVMLDKDPNFTDARHKRDKARQAFEPVESRVEQQKRSIRAKREHRIEEEKQHHRDEEQKRDDLARQQEEMREKNRSIIDELTRVAQISVDSYHDVLCRTAIASGSNITFRKTGVDVEMTPEIYRGTKMPVDKAALFEFGEVRALQSEEDA